jgi:replication factor C subunit 3/5
MFCKGVKLIILDEADSMTFDAQFALRRIIEKYSRTTRFCLICNYENKIIPAIRSRCANFRFSPISSQHVEKKLENICENENIQYEKKVLESISLLSKGDLRKSINFLQSLSLQSNHITLSMCYKTAGVPSYIEVKDLLENLLDNTISYNTVNKKIDSLIKSQGYSLSIVLKELVSYLVNNLELLNRINSDKLAIYLSEMSDLENRVIKSTFDDIYMSCLVGIFKKD